MMNDASTNLDADILQLIDLERYPVDRMESASGEQFVQTCADHMSEHGWCNLDGFIHKDALELLAAETNELMRCAQTLTIKRNIYQGIVDPTVPEGDPRRREYTHIANQLADDQIPDTTLIQRLYQSEKFTEFVRRVQGKDRLYRYADEFQALNIVALPPDSWHGWHYDVNECTVTLLLQAAERGGEFTFLPDVRSATGEDRAVVDQFLAGDMTHSRSFPRGAGTLTLFRGENSLHGVTRVEGERPRITAIFAYDEQEGRVAGDEINIRIYGPRVERILAERNT